MLMAVLFSGCQKTDGTVAIVLWSGCGKNNSQDVMHAAVNHKIEIVNPDGALDGGKASIFICEGGCMLFKNHLFEKL